MNVSQGRNTHINTDLNCLDFNSISLEYRPKHVCNHARFKYLKPKKKYAKIH